MYILKYSSCYSNRKHTFFLCRRTDGPGIFYTSHITTKLLMRNTEERKQKSKNVCVQLVCVELVCVELVCVELVCVELVVAVFVLLAPIQ